MSYLKTIILSALVLLLGITLSTHAAGLRVGDELPDLESFGMEGSLPSVEGKVVLVDFWADWCGPCHAIAPNLAKAVEEEKGRVLLAKLEVDEGENMKLAGRHNVRGFPTVMLFKDGEAVDHFTSARPMHFIRDFIHQHLGPENSD